VLASITLGGIRVWTTLVVCRSKNRRARTATRHRLVREIRRGVASPATSAAGGIGVAECSSKDARASGFRDYTRKMEMDEQQQRDRDRDRDRRNQHQEDERRRRERISRKRSPSKEDARE